MSDAPKDLRQCAENIGRSYPIAAAVCRQAADHIDTLQAENQRLRDGIQEHKDAFLHEDAAHEDEALWALLGGGE